MVVVSNCWIQLCSALLDSSTPAPLPHPRVSFFRLGFRCFRAVSLSDVMRSPPSRGVGAPSESRRCPIHCYASLRRPPAKRGISESCRRRLSSGFAARRTAPMGVCPCGPRNGERVPQGGQGTQSRARAFDGPGALLTTRWAAHRRGFDSRWQPRVVHASKHTCGCPAQYQLRRTALSLESDIYIDIYTSI